MTFRAYIRAVRANISLGWALDGNWAPPLVYLLVTLTAPISGVLMLIYMYKIVLGGGSDPFFLAFMLTGAAAFMFVRLSLAAAGMVVVEDREHYRMFRYIYSAPAPFPLQILGRVLPKVGIAAIAAVVPFIAGRVFFNLPFNRAGIDWEMLLTSLLIALFGMGAMGWMLASLMLLIDRMGWVFAEGIAGLLFLLTGAVIPLDIIPAPLALIGKSTPIAYWIDLWRLAVYGDAVKLALQSSSIPELWNRLLTSTIIWLVFAIMWNIAADKLARRWGRIERETFY